MDLRSLIIFLLHTVNINVFGLHQTMIVHVWFLLFKFPRAAIRSTWTFTVFTLCNSCSRDTIRLSDYRQNAVKFKSNDKRCVNLQKVLIYYLFRTFVTELIPLSHVFL